jgi:dTDP-glucose 4,6-dehydratase
MIISALEGRPLPVYGSGANVRDWLHVEDHAQALLAVVARGSIGESYLIGGRSERRNLHVVEQICDAVDSLTGRAAGTARRLITYVTDRSGHDFRYAIDPSHAERDLAWRPRYGFEDGLAMTVRWYLDNRAWWEPLVNNRAALTRQGLAR